MEESKLIPFEFEQLPSAFLSENPGAKKLREKLMTKKLVGEIDCGDDTLSQTFFSNRNIDIINKQIVLLVFKKTDKKIKIPFQSIDDIMVVMRWVYTNYARNLPFKIKEQIVTLNNKTVCQLVPNLISAAEQHLDYLRYIERPLDPLPPPINASRDRTLPSISEIYHG